MPTTIQAAVCRAFDTPLVVENLQLADPQEGQIQVRVLASAICHSDIHYLEGAWGGELPAVWGHEAAGVVEKLGPGVEGVIVGDHVVVTLIRSCGDCRNCRRGASVTCTGELPDHPTPLTDAAGMRVGHGMNTAAFAERVVVHRSQAVTIDPGIALPSAALLACGVITGFGAVANTAAVEAGSTVVVIGTGGVGLNAVQAARVRGADAVIAVDVSDAKLDVAPRFGATHTINSARCDLVDAVREITSDAGADYVFVTVGAPQPMEQAPQLLAANGAMVIVGMPASGVTTALDPGTLASRNQRILGSKMGTATVATDIPQLIDLYRSGELLLDPLISGSYSLDDINEAIDAVRSGDAVRNVIVFGHA